MVGSLKENLKKITNEISLACERSGRTDQPQLIAVSKKQPIEKIKTLYQLGVRDFAENYMQEAIPKIELLKDLDIHWHYIGQIQSKKIPQIVKNFDWIHSVSSIDELHKIEVFCEKIQKKLNCLLQVNIADEKSKQGFSKLEFDQFLLSPWAGKQIHLSGMMIFPPLTDNESETRQYFHQAFELFLKAQKVLGPQWAKLSMGTSHDFVWAIEAGSHYVRVGERLFGPRN